MIRRENEVKQWELDRKEIVRDQDRFPGWSEVPGDVLSLAPHYVWDQRIRNRPDYSSDPLDDREEFKFSTEIPVLDRRMKDLQSIKNLRSRELFAWICDVVDDEGENLPNLKGKLYQFGITDEDDMEVPVTFDFKSKKPMVYLGQPESADKALAAKVYMSEPDFHKILDKELGVNNAVLSRRIRIEGGLSGA